MLVSLCMDSVCGCVVVFCSVVISVGEVGVFSSVLWLWVRKCCWVFIMNSWVLFGWCKVLSIFCSYFSVMLVLTRLMVCLLFWMVME